MFLIDNVKNLSIVGTSYTNSKNDYAEQRLFDQTIRGRTELRYYNLLLNQLYEENRKI